MGRKQTEETKLKISKIHKGKRIGSDNPFYGKHHTEEAKTKMSKARKGKPSWNKGKHWSAEIRKKISEANKNPSKETREKMRKAKEGYIPWNKNKTNIYSEKTLKIMREKSRARITKPETREKMHKSAHKGEDHWNWKGGTTDEIRKRVSQWDWLKLARKIRKRDDFTCLRCKKRGWVIHHMIPVRLGGKDIPENLVTLCPGCHHYIESKVVA